MMTNNLIVVCDKCKRTYHAGVNQENGCPEIGCDGTIYDAPPYVGEQIAARRKIL